MTQKPRHNPMLINDIPAIYKRACREGELDMVD
jgi:hypothetical protein